MPGLSVSQPQSFSSGWRSIFLFLTWWLAGFCSQWKQDTQRHKFDKCYSNNQRINKLCIQVCTKWPCLLCESYHPGFMALPIVCREELHLGAPAGQGEHQQVRKNSVLSWNDWGLQRPSQKVTVDLWIEAPGSLKGGCLTFDLSYLPHFHPHQPFFKCCCFYNPKMIPLLKF